MTGPLVVLGVLSAVGGWLNLPRSRCPLGPVGVLEHWLEPVVGAATLRVARRAPAEAVDGTEYCARSARRSSIAVAGIAIAVVALKPAALVPKAQAPDRSTASSACCETSTTSTRSTTRGRAADRSASRAACSGSGIDAGIIDGLFVNGSAWLARGVGWIGSQLQSGQVGTYAWVLVVGVLAVLGAFTFR